MDCRYGRDALMGVSSWFIRNMPETLKELVIQYQDARYLSSFSAAVRELIETHPEIAKRVHRAYADGDSSLER